MNNEHTSYPDFPEDIKIAELERRIAELEEVNAVMRKDVAFLETLEAYGVDNWDGYEHAADEWRNKLRDKDDE